MRPTISARRMVIIISRTGPSGDPRHGRLLEQGGQGCAHRFDLLANRPRTFPPTRCLCYFCFTTSQQAAATAVTAMLRDQTAVNKIHPFLPSTLRNIHIQMVLARTPQLGATSYTPRNVVLLHISEESATPFKISGCRRGKGGEALGTMLCIMLFVVLFV